MTNLFMTLALAFTIAHAKAGKTPPVAPVSVTAKPLIAPYSSKVIAFDEWPNNIEKRVLNLFPTFRDDAEKAGWKGAPSHDVILFIAQEGALIPKKSEDVDLQSLVNKEVVDGLQRGLTNLKTLSYDQVITNQKDYLAYRNPPGRHWCENAALSLCLESTFLFDEALQTFLAPFLMVATMSTDTTIMAESELHAEKASDLSFAQVSDLITLTGISTPPAGTVVQNIFWFNHVVEFGKVMAVLQPHPGNAQQSILTGYVIFGIERKWWDRKLLGLPVKEIFLGQHLPRPTGLGMGLPKVTQQIFETLAEKLSHSP